MRGAPRAQRNILHPRRAVKVGGRPLIAIVIPHESRSLIDRIGIDLLRKKNPFDSRRSRVAVTTRKRRDPSTVKLIP
jgi:hypothetical protein